jgi:hypothetical protein
MANRMSVQDRFKALRKNRIESTGISIAETLQNVSKQRIDSVLQKVDRRTRDTVDCVFALLDDGTESFKGLKFSDGATVAHLGSHIGFLQRGGDIKLDREGRDYWIKPLKEIGAIEAVTLNEGVFISGHVKAKSPNSSYRLDNEFAEILKAPDDEWERRLTKWIGADATRRRLEMQAKAAAESKKSIDAGHKQLIQASINFYVPHFLPEFEVLYIDDSDGDRISANEKKALEKAGVAIGLGDAFPDILLWNPRSDKLWCIEAVTSDGEVDAHKMEQMRRLATRHDKKGIGFTTTYKTWKAAASRQDANRNLGIGSYVWISSDPSRQFEVKSFEQELIGIEKMIDG